MQVQRTGRLHKEKTILCTVPGRFIQNPRTVAQNFPSALTSHQVWNSSHFPACWPCGLALGVLATRGWEPGSLSPCLPPCLAVGLVVAVPLQVLGASPRQCSPLFFWVVAPPRARWAFLLAVQRRHRCPMRPGPHGHWLNCTSSSPSSSSVLAGHPKGLSPSPQSGGLSSETSSLFSRIAGLSPPHIPAVFHLLCSLLGSIIGSP